MCSNCHIRDKAARKTQGLFECNNCNRVRTTNADYNCAMNILQRGLILSSLGGFLTYHKPQVIVDRNKMITKELTYFSGGRMSENIKLRSNACHF